MAKTKASKNGFFDAAEVFGDFRPPRFDVDAIVATQRKNFEALSQANQLAVEGVQAVARRQAEIMREAVDEASGLFREWTQPGAPEDRLAKTAEAVKQAYEKGLANARELNELTKKASTDAFSVIARRISESFDDVRLYAKKHTSAV